jgi:hypothetical protein
MTASTCRCPVTTAMVLVPLMAVLLALEVLTWAQQALCSVQYWRQPQSCSACLTRWLVPPS